VRDGAGGEEDDGEGERPSHARDYSTARLLQWSAAAEITVHIFRARLVEIEWRWREDGLDRMPTASVADVRSFEDTFHVRLTPELSEYFRLLNGMPLNAMDREHFHWCPLAEVCPTGTWMNADGQGVYHGSFVFADFLIASHAYAIDVTDRASRGRVVIVGGEPPLHVADSFYEFVDRYLDDPQTLFRAKQ
jgi:hypothetical protein